MANGIRPAALLFASLVAAAPPLQAAPVHPRGQAHTQDGLPGSAALPADAVRTLPVSVIENRGQIDSAVRFYVQASGKSVYFTPDGVTYALTSPATGARSADRATRATRWAVKLSFPGADPNASIEGLDKRPGIISHFSGKPSDWKTGLPTYGSIIYRNLWPGIDLKFDANISQIKYKFVVQPGADPAQIQIAYTGAGISIDPLGQLVASTPLGGFHDAAPFSYQDRGGSRLPVASSYRIDSADENGGTYGFALGAYDRSATLVIDPSVTVYAGYIGGVDVDAAHALAVDAAGNAYVAGETASAADFPTAAGPDTSFNGGNRDAFVAKISADGTTLLYAGFLGGAADDYATGIAIDSAGNAYVTGETRSNQSTFPVIGGPDLSFNGASDAFVAKINAAGTALLYSGYIGGGEMDAANAIAVDSAGNAYIAGDTFSPEATFPVAVGPDLTFNGVRDAFVAKVNVSGSALSYAGYIGGAQFDIARAIAVDAGGSAYVAGETASNESSFPVSGGPDLTYNGGSRDAFVAQVAPGGAALSYAGYIGGAGDDIAHAIAVNAAGESFVAGETSSTESSFPISRGPGLTYGGGSRDAFAAKVNPGGGSLFYSGFIGGAGTDIARAAALDNGGSLVVSGATSSAESTFPLVIGPGLTFNGVRDAFASKVNPAGTGLLFSGYFGGAGDDAANAVAVDAAGNLYLAGSSSSTEASFPAIAGPDLTANGSNDAFVAKINVGEPHITAEGVVNAGSYKVGPIAPGEIVSIFGTSIGPDDPLLAQLDSNGRVATTLGSTTVLFGSDPGALFYVSDTQINVQAPYSIDGASTVDIRIANDGFETNTITVPVAPSAPGVFTSDASGSGQAAAVDVNGNLNTADNSVGPGDVIIIFATGEGQTDPAGVTGKLAEQPFPVPVLPVKLLIGGIEAQLLYAGAAPGFAGLLQINAIVPAGVAPLNAAEGGARRVEQSGNGIPVELIIGDESSQPDVFLNFTGGTGIGVPIADPQSVTTNEDTPRNITLTGGDPADQPLTFSILSGPANGSLGAFGATTPTSASLTYTPALNFNGPDSFQFQVLDPDGNTASATVGITVLPVNDPPVAVDDSRSTDPGDSVVISVLANDSDPDNDPLTVTAVGNPANGTAGTNGTTVTYTPNSGFTGTDSFSYTISDGALTDSATITVRVRGSSNEGPSAAPQSLMTEQGVPIVITLTGSDPDGDDLTFGIQSGPSNGTLSAITQLTNETATVTYTPNPSFFGIDQFTYVVTDEHGTSSPGIITIQVKGVTDMAITKTDTPDPVLSGSMLTYNIAVANLGPNDAPNVVVTDPLPGVVTFVSATPSQGGCVGGAVVTCNLGTIPNGGGATIAIVVTVNTGLRTGIIDNTASVASDLVDLNLGNNSASASTMVINQPPVIGNPTAAADTVGNTQLKVAQLQAPQTVPEVFYQNDLLTLANVTDINGDPLTFSVAGTTTNGGTVIITNPGTGEFTYFPPAGNNAPDSFIYSVQDPGNPAVNGTVNITFTGLIWYVKNDFPEAGAGTSAAPFKTLAEAQTASSQGEDIFVHFGDGTTTGQDAGITLKNDQRLIGEGVALDIDLALNGGAAPTPLFPAGTHPLIDNTAAASNGVTASDVTGIEVRGINAQGVDNGVLVTCTTGAVNAVVSDNIVRFAGQVGLGVIPGGTCALSATIENNDLTAARFGLGGSAHSSSTLNLAANHNTATVSTAMSSIPITISSLGGSVVLRSFDSNSVSGLSAAGVAGIWMDTVTFDADPSTPNTFEPVPGGATVIGDIAGPGPVAGPGMQLIDVSGNLEFTSLDIEAGNGVGLQATGTGVFTPGPPDTGFRIAIGGGVIHAQNGPALDLDPLTTDITLGQITSVNSTSTGVSLTDLTGTITINNDGAGSSITGATGAALVVNGGDVVVTYGGTTTAGTGLAVNILNRAGGSATFSGAIASDAPGQGISITGGTAANTVAFNGAVNLGQTTPLTTTGVTMTGNHTDTEVHFTAPLNIATSGAAGILGSAAGTLTTVGGTIDTENHRAVTTTGLGFGPASLNFDTITVNNAASMESGIVLEDFTGTANLGVVDLITTTGTALFLANGGTVTTLPGSTISTSFAQAINANDVDFGFGSLHFNSILASSTGPPVMFMDTRGRANLMGGSVLSASGDAIGVVLQGSNAFELILSGTSLGTGSLDVFATNTSALCLSAAGNMLSAFDVSALASATVSVVQQDATTLSALNGGATVNEIILNNAVIAYGQGCLAAPVPGDPFGTPPTANPDSGGTILEGGMVDVNVTANDTDPDTGDGLFLSGITTPPTLGTATILSPTTVRYTQNVTIGADSMDSFVYQIVDKSGNTAMATVSVGITNVNDPPMIANATITYDALGNTALEVLEGGTQSPPSLFLDQTADSLIGKANISDADGPGPLTCTLTGTPPLGTVAFLPNSCDFTYVPPAGNRGDGTAAAADSFQYEVSDNSAPTPGTATGTVEINIDGIVWYVKDDHPGPFDGTSTNPFNKLADLDAVADDPADASLAGDTIFVFHGSTGTTPLATPTFTLKDGQRLLGEGVDLTTGGIYNGVNNQILVDGDPSKKPHIVGTDATTVFLPNVAGEVRGLRIEATGITGLNILTTSGPHSVIVTDNTLESPASMFGLGTPLDVLSNGLSADLRLAFSRNMIVSRGVTAYRIRAISSGAMFVTEFADNQVLGFNPGPTFGTFSDISNVIFDSDPTTAGFQTVQGGNTSFGTAADPLPNATGFILLGVAGDLNFSNLSVFATFGIDANGVAPFDSAAETGFRLNAGGGEVETSVTALDLNTMTVGNGAPMIIDRLSASGAAVFLKDVRGQLHVQDDGTGSLISSSGGTAFQIEGGDAAITYDGDIVNSGGLVANIINRTGGSAIFNGAITSNSPGQGINITGAAAASNTTFNGNVDLGVTMALGSAGVNVNHNSTASTTAFANLDIVTSGADGLTAMSGGTLNVTTGTVSATNGTALNIANTGTTSFTLASLAQTGTAPSNGINILNSTGTKDFIAVNIANTSGIGIGLSNAGTVNIDNGSPTSSINSTGVPAFISDSTILGVNFMSTTSTGGANNIVVNGASGSASFGVGALAGSSGDAFQVNGGNATISYAGSITNGSTGDVVNILNATGGSVTLSGNITDNTGGTGITLLNNNGGSPKTITFSGTAKTISTGANIAVNLDNNDNATINFSNGGLAITTTSVAGFNAVNGAAGINVTGAGNTVTSTTGAAVIINGSTIGASGITFQSINSTTASANTVVNLVNTGAGTFTVSGTGTTGGSGGTIDNKTADAITLNNTDGRVTLKNMIIEDIGSTAGGFHTRSQHDAIHGQTVDGGLTLDNTTIRRISDMCVNGALFSNGVSATVWNGLDIVNGSLIEDCNRFHVAGVADDSDESGVRIVGLKGTVSITDSTFRRTGEHLDIFTDTTGTLTMTVQNSTFNNAYKEFTSGAVASVGKMCLDVTVVGSANANVTVGDQNNAALGNTFLNCKVASVRIGNDTGATGTLNAIVVRNTFETDDFSSGIGGDIDFPMSGVKLITRGEDSANLNGIIANNTFTLVANADGGVGQLTLDLEDGNHQVKVANNMFDRPFNAPWYVRADSSVSAKIQFTGNTTIQGQYPCTDVSCDDGIPGDGFVGPGIRSLVEAQNGSILDATFTGDTLAKHDTGFDPGNTMEARVLNVGGGGTMCVSLSNNKAPDGYALEQFAGTLNLHRGASAQTNGCTGGAPANCITVVNDNGNTGGAGNALTVPPVVTAIGTVNNVAGACALPAGGIF